MIYNIKERSIPLQILQDKIILHTNNKVKIICFRNDINNKDEEIIIIFKGENNIEKILSQIEKVDFKFWLKDRDFKLDFIDELEIEEYGCKLMIINKNIKLKLGKVFLKNKIRNAKLNLIDFKYKITNELKGQLGNEIEKSLMATGYLKKILLKVLTMMLCFDVKSLHYQMNLIYLILQII